MAHFSRTGKKTLRVADVLSDHGSSIGSLLRRASFLMQLEHLLAGFMDPALAAHFQVADLGKNHLTLISPSASWATSLRMQAPQLVQALQRAGYTDIERIEIRVAPLVEQPRESRKCRPLSPAAEHALAIMNRLQANDEE